MGFHCHLILRNYLLVWDVLGPGRDWWQIWAKHFPCHLTSCCGFISQLRSKGTNWVFTTAVSFVWEISQPLNTSNKVSHNWERLISLNHVFFFSLVLSCNCKWQVIPVANGIAWFKFGALSKQKKMVFNCEWVFLDLFKLSNELLVILCWCFK